MGHEFGLGRLTRAMAGCGGERAAATGEERSR